MGDNTGYDRTDEQRQQTRQHMIEENFTQRGHAADGARAQDSRRLVIDPILDVSKGAIRECCDVPGQPLSTPINVIMDGTDSRGEDAVVIFERMPRFVGRLQNSGIIPYPVFSMGMFGDATAGDHVPVQVSQYECDSRLDNIFKAMKIERKGGGNGRESAELLAYYYAYRTKLEATKRQAKGLSFFLTDEQFYDFVAKDQARAFLGVDLDDDVPSTKVFSDLQRLFDTYCIYVEKPWETHKTQIDSEIRKRVQEAGGMIEGVDIRASLLWFNNNDLDLHVVCPSGEEIYYGHKHSRCDGFLDVDMNVGGETTKPVENTRWEKGKAPKGHYRVFVQNYRTHNGCGCETEFRVEVEIGGKVQQFTGKTPARVTGSSSNTPVFEFDFDPEQGLLEPKDIYPEYKPEAVIGKWGSVLGPDHVLVVKDPKSCVDVMIGVAALTRAGYDLPKFLEYLVECEQTPERIKDVERALSKLVTMGVSTDVGAVASAQGGARKKRSKRL